MRLTPLLVSQQMSKQFSRITALPEKAYLIGKECLTNSQIVPHKNPNSWAPNRQEGKAWVTLLEKNLTTSQTFWRIQNKFQILIYLLTRQRCRKQLVPAKVGRWKTAPKESDLAAAWNVLFSYPPRVSLLQVADTPKCILSSIRVTKILRVIKSQRWGPESPNKRSPTACP